jgi:hypothetical protein
MSAAVDQNVTIDTSMYDEDEPTIIEARHPKQPAPPALPFVLRRKKDTEAWLESLPVETRLVLEMVRSHQGRWPRAARVPNAIANPISAIPSLAAIARRR